MNKEQVYDEKINPLVAQIIAICKENGIAMLSTFSIPTEEYPGLCVTTMIPDEDGDNGPNHKIALGLIKGNAHSFTISEISPDGSRHVTACLG